MATEDVPALIGRLRGMPGWWKFKQTADEAADALATLSSTADELAGSVVALGRKVAERDEQIATLSSTVARLTAERDALAVDTHYRR